MGISVCANCCLRRSESVCHTEDMCVSHGGYVCVTWRTQRREHKKHVYSVRSDLSCSSKAHRDHKVHVSTFSLVSSKKIMLHVRGHVQSPRERKVCVHLLLQHCGHVEAVPHGVHAQIPRQLAETRSVGRQHPSGIKYDDRTSTPNTE